MSGSAALNGSLTTSHDYIRLHRPEREALERERGVVRELEAALEVSRPDPLHEDLPDEPRDLGEVRALLVVGETVHEHHQDLRPAVTLAVLRGGGEHLRRLGHRKQLREERGVERGLLRVEVRQEQVTHTKRL